MVIRLGAGTFKVEAIMGKVEKGWKVRVSVNGWLFSRLDLIGSSLIQATSPDENLGLRHFSCTNPYAAPEDISEAAMRASSFTDTGTTVSIKESWMCKDSRLTTTAT